MGLRLASFLNHDIIDNHIAMFVILLQGDISYDDIDNYVV